MNKILCVIAWTLVAGSISAAQGEELSKRKVKEIAEEYVEAIIDQDYEAWSGLMANPTGVSEEAFMAYYTKPARINHPFSYWLPTGKLKRLKILSIKESVVQLEFQIKDRGGISPKGYLLILPDGKIKYDAIHVWHPILWAKLYASYLNHMQPFPSGKRHELYSSGLISTGIPLFDFDPNASQSDQRKSLNKIETWMEDNCNEWDSSEPKLFFPKKLTTDWFHGGII